MKRAYTYLLMALVLSVACSTKNDSAMSKDKKEVALVIEKRYKALNQMFTGDISLIKEIWSHADDVTYMGPGGGIRIGWNEVLKDWESQAALKLGGSVSPSNIHYTLGKDMAVVVNDEVGKNIDDEGKLETVHIRATHVLRKENGQWKIIAEQTDKLSFVK